MLRFGKFPSFLAAMSITLAITAASRAQDQERPRVMLVLDGSASMWARLEGDVPKIDVAKKMIAELVGGWEAKMEFGITTYGHREEANCQDIETVLPVAEVDSGRVVNVVDDIMPRGRTPLTAALRQAAEMLDYKTRPATILLVSDGIENCGQDPCEVVAELTASAKDLTIDIIGFDMNNHEMGQLECIAANAKGHMVRADISDIAETMGHRMTVVIEGEEPTATLSLSTVFADQAVTEDVRYVISLSKDGELTPVAESLSVAPTFTLPAGKFMVEAIRGEGAGTLSKTVEIELADGAEVDYVFKLAEFRVRSLQSTPPEAEALE